MTQENKGINSMNEIGKKIWLVPDAYYPEASVEGPYISHEAICVLNIGEKDADISITLYFENEDPVSGFNTKCKAKRTNHIRLDQITNNEGKSIPKGKPYALLVQSSQNIICQYSRLDTTQIQMTLMTTIAY